MVFTFFKVFFFKLIKRERICDRPYVAHKPRISTVWPFKKKKIVDIKYQE